MDEQDSGPNVEPCAVCGLPLAIGQQGCITTIRPHDPVLTYYPFVHYFDIGLGETVTSFADRWRHMRQKGLQYRDLPSKGDISARRDRAAQEHRERARG